MKNPILTGQSSSVYCDSLCVTSICFNVNFLQNIIPVVYLSFWKFHCFLVVYWYLVTDTHFNVDNAK